MGMFHFLNVGSGDCSIIQHGSGNVTVVDVSRGGQMARLSPIMAALLGHSESETSVDPIEYLKARGVNSVFRFVLTHPDMDHLDGIKPLFEAFHPVNFWDTDNNVEKPTTGFDSRFDSDDWKFYKRLRDSKPTNDPKRLVLYSGATGPFYNRDQNGVYGGDGLTVLAPTPALCKAACESGNCNDFSYVIRYEAAGGTIVLSGDSHDATWEHILAHHSDLVRNVDVLVAPHHGRDSGRDYRLLDVLRPKLTLFGIADAEHFDLSEWTRRGLVTVGNREGGNIVLDMSAPPIRLYVSNARFAARFPYSYFDQRVGAYFCTVL